MAWYLYDQNMSGGYYFEPAFAVLVEADNPEEANRRAETVGIYFNGVEEGEDCECCGDRWIEQSRPLVDSKVAKFISSLKKISEEDDYRIEKTVSVLDKSGDFTLYEAEDPYEVFALYP
ncbi:MAG: hypothetical protein D6698_17455 [Gammaproteobacteria bacterium]|nr:MAG: hypothetical protein D6698_17455 [Gammaproteobacteria bacterium]